LTHANQITAIILAGGRGSRMGGVDKGLQNFNGTPLALHTLMRLQMQEGGLVSEVMVNANRNLSAYESMGVPVWPDADSEFAGPLSGFLVGLERCETPYLLTVPCDTPLFPLDLAARLLQALEQDDADIAMAAAPEADEQGQVQVRRQPVFCLLKRDLMESLLTYMNTGGRKIDAWTAQHKTSVVQFDDTKAFFNANTIAELHQLEQTGP
jgi:molybdenum cofactor guanylyltransferase